MTLPKKVCLMDKCVPIVIAVTVVVLLTYFFRNDIKSLLSRFGLVESESFSKSDKKDSPEETKAPEPETIEDCDNLKNKKGKDANVFTKWHCRNMVKMKDTTKKARDAMGM